MKHLLSLKSLGALCAALLLMQLSPLAAYSESNASTPIPEPGTWAMLLLILALLAALTWRGLVNRPTVPGFLLALLFCTVTGGSRVSAQVLDPITGVSVLTSSSTVAGSPSATVSNASLEAGPSTVLGASDSIGDSGWTNGTTNNGIWATPLVGATITYDLGADYNVSDLLIWNYSQSDFNYAGFNSVEILSSTTGTLGSFSSVGTYTFNEVTQQPNYGDAPRNYVVPAQVLAVPISDARYIELVVLSDYGDVDNTGINEVNFVGSVVPEPDASAMLLLGGLGLLATLRWRRLIALV